MLGSVPFLCNFRVEVQVLGPGSRLFFWDPAKVHWVHYPKTFGTHGPSTYLGHPSRSVFHGFSASNSSQNCPLEQVLVCQELESTTRLAHILKKEWTSNCRDRSKETAVQPVLMKSNFPRCATLLISALGRTTGWSTWPM